MTTMLKSPLVLGDQGSFFFGGQVTKSADGDTLHTDAAFARFQAPPDPAWPPIVMWHGGRQFGKTYETTPDGREGYQQIWVRRGHPVYVIDQARRGGASQASLPTARPGPTADALVFNLFRLGIWEPPAEPTFFPNVSFPLDQASLDQFWFQSPTVLLHEERNNEDRDFHAAKMGQLLDRIGPSIMLTHSHSGAYGWTSAMHRPEKVRAIVSYEPNVYAFPADAVPADTPIDNPLALGFSPLQVVSPERFETLTRMPIQIIFGDNIQRSTPNKDIGSQHWHLSSRRAEQFAEAVNCRGGRVEILHLPDRGVRGNTHFPFADLNNLAVADLLSEFLAEHGLGAPASR
jgi:hypothetical protein